MDVELIYDRGCPNVAAARRQLLHAFARVGVTPRWHEWQSDGADTPAYARRYGSPTILVNGRDVAQEADARERCCRIYPGDDGAIARAPAIERIAAALGAARQADSGGCAFRQTERRFLNLAVLSAFGIALLPKLSCFACWPAYAGLMSALGLSFLIEHRWLLSLTVLFLTATLVALGLGARRRGRLGPLMLGIGAGTLIVAGKSQWENDLILYAGVTLLLAAAAWNTRPGAGRGPRARPACASPRRSPSFPSTPDSEET